MLSDEEKKARHKVIARNWYLKNRELSIARTAEWRKNNPDKYQAQLKNCNVNIEARRKARKRWKEKNKEKERASNLIRVSKRNKLLRKTCPRFKMRETLRSRLGKAISEYKKVGLKKYKSTEGLLGCSFSYFVSYIESKFTDGMSWDNHGIHGWHVDHIKAICNFDLTDPEQQKQCFHYTNLQPLWWHQNLAKRFNKITNE